MSEPAAPVAAAPTHVYRHPDNYGLGHHHAGEDLSTRPHVPMGLPEDHQIPEKTMETLGFLGPQHAQTMQELDLHHGTPVAHTGRDEDRDLEIVEWADAFGIMRRTTITPADFAEFFAPQEAQA